MFSTEEKNQLYLHLIELGCCRLCSLRYLCDTSIPFDGTDSYLIENKDVEIIEESKIQMTKKSKPSPCVVCLGLLQDYSFQTVLDHKLLVNVKLYDSEDFTCSISIPACILLREKAMRWYLQEKFSNFFKQDSIEIPLNRAWKLFVKDKFAKTIEKKYVNSEICDFSINISMDYYSNEEELAVLQKMQPDIFEQRRTQKRKFNNELYSRKGVVDVLERTSSGVFRTHYTLPPSIPSSNGLFCSVVECKHNSIFIAARYCKYSRQLSQSPWFIDGKKTMATSIHEIIFDAVVKESGTPEKNFVFSASGREDLDVRCLGNGRPFYIEITDPWNTKFKYEQFRRIEEEINSSGLIKVKHLQQVQKSDLKYIKEGEEHKTKEYHALCVCSIPVTEEHIEKLCNFGTIELLQKTPVRVLHRRPLTVRKKKIHRMTAKILPGRPRLFELFVTTQAGTYVKEFVHGDFGRTKPNICDILEMDVDIAALDVTAVNLNWPIPIDYYTENIKKEGSCMETLDNKVDDDACFFHDVLLPIVQLTIKLREEIAKYFQNKTKTMSGKKLSFGFTNTVIKKRIIISAKHTEAPKSVDLIDCLEGQTIKIKDAIVEEKKPLVIPIQPDDKNLVQRVIAAKQLKERSKKSNEIEIEDSRPDSELTLDELAARQLITEAKGQLEASASKNEALKIRVVPAVDDTLILEGSKEPTLDDYENVPIGDFGIAMLRGMGWSEKTGIGKERKSSSVAVPELRPKGMGLGAYKLIQEEVPKKVAVDKDGKELSLVKGACAKIVAGKEKGLYCKVEGLDDESGRIIVKMAIKGTTISLNEFKLCPVTLEEYSTSSRILNNSKYRDYQERETISSSQANVQSNSSTSKQGAQDLKKIKTEIKKEQERTRTSRSPNITKKEDKHRERKSRRSRSYDGSSSENDRKNVKKYRDRSRSFEKKRDKRHVRNRQDRSKSFEYKIDHRRGQRNYKNKSRSPSYHRGNKREATKSSSKYRSRSRSCEKYDRKQGNSKKHEVRKSRSSSLHSSSSSNSSSNYSNKIKDKSESSKLKHRSSSIIEDRSTKSKYLYESIPSKSKSSVQKFEKRKNYSNSDSPSDYEQTNKDKKARKHNKSKKKKSSTKRDSSYSDGEKKKTHDRDKHYYSSECDSSDEKFKGKSSKRR